MDLDEIGWIEKPASDAKHAGIMEFSELREKIKLALDNDDIESFTYSSVVASHGFG